MDKLTKKAEQLHKNFLQIIYHFQTVTTERSESSESLSMQESNAIDFIGQRQSVIMREIAGFMKVAVSTVTGLVDKLEEKDLVRRERSVEDRRIINITLTPKGEEIYQFHIEEFIRLCRGMLTGLTGEEQDAYIELSGKIANSARENFVKDNNGTNLN